MRRLVLLVFTLPLWAVETVWVHKSYVGGPLCAKGGPEINFVAPGIEATAEPLRAINIRIARSYFINLPTCQACGKCPTYKREILFEIEADKITAAEKAGFLRLLAALWGAPRGTRFGVREPAREARSHP